VQSRTKRSIVAGSSLKTKACVAGSVPIRSVRQDDSINNPQATSWWPDGRGAIRIRIDAA